MLTAIYKDNTICSLDTKNKYGNYETDIYEEYKKAGQTGLIKCEECGSIVHLRAGDIRIPYFAHNHINRECSFEKSNNESEEQRKGKFILYRWVKDQFDYNVYVDKMYGSRRANVSIEIDGGVLAFQYIRKERSIKEWNDKREDYSTLGIRDFYFFSSKDFREKFKNSEEQFRRIVQKYSMENTIKMLDTDNHQLTLMRYLDLRNNKEELVESYLFRKKYNLFDIALNEDGTLDNGFNNDFLKFKEIKVKEFNIKLEVIRQKELNRQKVMRMQNEMRLIDIQNKEKMMNLQYGNNENGKDKLELDYIINTKLYRTKYSNDNGFTFDDLDEIVKKIIRNNPEAPWWQGGIRWILCKHCKRYYISDKCISYGGIGVESTLGICRNCDTERNRRVKLT